MEGKVLRIILHRCDEKIKIKSKEVTTGLMFKEEPPDPDLGFYIKPEPEELQNGSNLYNEIIGLDYAHVTFEDQLEALLKSEMQEDYKPVTETITFYGSTDHDHSDSVEKPIVVKVVKDVFQHLKTVHDISSDGSCPSASPLRKRKDQVYSPTSVLTCPICEKTFTRRNMLSHWKVVHKLSVNERRQLDPENKSTNLTSKLKATIEKMKHRWFVSQLLDGPLPLNDPNMTYKCKICDFETKTSFSIRRHEITLHGYNRNKIGHRISSGHRPVRVRPSQIMRTTLECPLCEPQTNQSVHPSLPSVEKQTFPNKSSLRQHMHTVHKLPYEKCLEYFPMKGHQGQGHCSKDQTRSQKPCSTTTTSFQQPGLPTGGQGQQQDQYQFPTALTSFPCPLPFCQEMFETVKGIRAHWRDVHRLNTNSTD